MRLIDADAAIESLTEYGNGRAVYIGVEEAVRRIEQLPSAQPERLTDDDFETIRIHLNAYKEKLCNQQRWEEAEEYQRIIDRFMAFASAQSERPTGEWIQKPRYEDDEYPDAQPNLKCPFCGYEIGWCDMGNYCARCGADLKGGAV